MKSSTMLLMASALLISGTLAALAQTHPKKCPEGQMLVTDTKTGKTECVLDYRGMPAGAPGPSGTHR